MEPMTLGSPVGSPVSSMNIHPISNLGVITSPAPNNPYYPAYLMGESPSNMMSRIHAGNVSPSKKNKQLSSPNAVSSPHSPQISREKFFQSPRIGSEKHSGPPTLGLLGGLAQSPSTRVQSATFIDHSKVAGSPLIGPSSVQSPSVFNSPLSSTHIAAHGSTPYTPTKELVFGTCTEILSNSSVPDLLENTWVTVYGFPVASASFILTQFAQLGTITEQRLPGLGNWMHLKYQTKLQARKALSKNGQIFNGNIMIGVIPCTDQVVLSERGNTSLNTSAVYSPRDTPKKGFDSTPKSNMRPLTQAYQAARADIEVTPGSHTPKKSEGLVSKAIQHLLGI